MLSAHLKTCGKNDIICYFPYVFHLDHSFFSLEWQKRWCVLNNTIFYYFGSDKGWFDPLHNTKTYNVVM